jgi:iron complex outermembrane recepter protein
MKRTLLLFVLLISNLCYIFAQGKDVKDSLKTYHQGEIIISATKTETDIAKLPLSVGQLNKDQINSQITSNPNAGELVRSLPGVSVGFGNRNIPPWVHLRGTGYFIGRTLYMVDEIPLIEPRLIIAANPDNLEGVEVLLGPASSLYGPNASGGAIDAISRSGLNQQGLSIGSSYGTFNSFRPSISIGKTIGNWNFIASYNLDKSDGYKNTDLNTGLYLYQKGVPSYLNSVTIENQDYTNAYYYGKIGYKNELNTFGFSAGMHYFTEDLYGGKQNSKSDGFRIIGSGNIFYTIYDLAKFNLRFGYQELLGNSQSTKGMLKVAKTAINNRFIFTDIDNTYSYVYDPTITQKGKSDNKSIPVDFQSDWYLFEHHQITAGASYIKEMYESITYNTDKSKITSGTNYDIYRTAGYAQSLSDFLNKKLYVLLGIRYDNWKYTDIADSGSTIKHPPDVSKNSFNYRGGVKYIINDEISVRTSAGTAFWPGAATWFFQNMSTGNTWREANPDLKPEKTTMVDLGADFNFFNNTLQSSISFYYGKILDAMTYRYDQHPTLPGVQIIRTQNSDEVEIKGVEIGIKYHLMKDLDIFANPTFNKSEIKKSALNKNNGHQLRNCPDYFGNIGFTYTNNDYINLRIAGRYSADRYYDDENTQMDYYHMKEYFVVDCKFWKSFDLFGYKFTTSIGIDNIFDEKYDGEFIYNAPGRYIEAGIKYFINL